jgi:hypothetical protein
MFEAYKIGVKIGVIDSTGGGIIKLAAQLTKAQKAADGLYTALKNVNVELGKTRKGWAAGMADDFDSAAKAAGRYEQATRRAQAASGTTVGRITSSASPFLLAGALAGGRGGGGGGLPNNVLRLTGPNNPLYGAGGGAIARAGFGGFGGRGGGGGGQNVGPGGINWGRVVAGATVFRGGEDVLGMLHSPIEEAAAYQQAQARFRQYGLTDAQNASAFAFAKRMNAPGASYTDALDYMTEAQGVFRESGLSGEDALRGAKMAAPLLAKMSFAASSLDAETQAKMHTQELSALRFAEMRGGLKSPEAFNNIMNSAWKAIRSSGGNVDFEQYRQFMARGGVSAQGLSDKALYGELEPIIGELKGSTAGNALMTSYNRLTGAVRVPNQVAHMLADSGIWDKSKIVWNSQGGIKSFKGNPLKDMALMSSDPVQFYEKVIKPMYDKRGIKSDADIARENTMLFGRTGGALYTLINRQYAQTQMSADSQAKTKDIDGAKSDAEKTFDGNLKLFTAAWKNFKTEFGNAALPMITRGLQTLTPLLTHWAKIMDRHSGITTGIVVIMGAIGAMGVVAGPIIAAAGAIASVTAVLAAGGLGATILTVSGALGVAAVEFTAIYVAVKKIVDWAESKSALFRNAGDALGNGEAHVMAFFGNQAAKDAIAAQDKANALIHGPAYGNPSAAKSITVNTSVNLDGRKVAQNTTEHQANAMGSAQQGVSFVDSSKGAMSAGLNTGQ